MSDEINQSEPAPYVEMRDAYAQPKEPEKTWDGPSNIDNVQAAADERLRKKQQEQEPIERTYVDFETGERRPANETVSIERAADDLTRQRGFEKAESDNLAKEVLKFGVDAVRAWHDPAQLAQQQQAPDQQQPQPEQIQPQPASELPPEIAELQAELEKSPRLRAALQEEAARIQQAQEGAAQAQQAYVQATHEAAQAAATSFVAAFPELHGISLEQLPAALQVLQKSNPQRAAEAIRHLNVAGQLGKRAIAIQQQQAQAAQTQVQNWVRAQDAEMDAWLAKNETPETVRSVKEDLPRVIQEQFGMSPQEAGRYIAQNPILRSAPMQKLILSAVKYHLAQEGTAAKISKPVPPVQRPGTSQPRSSFADGEIAAARERFLKNPDDPKLAAAYVAARRAAKE